MRLTQIFGPELGRSDSETPADLINTVWFLQFEEEDGDLDTDELAKKLTSSGPRNDGDDVMSDDPDDDKYLSEAAREKKKNFSSKRKNHYNEFQNIQKARELIESELAELDDDEWRRVMSWH